MMKEEGQDKGRGKACVMKEGETERKGIYHRGRGEKEGEKNQSQGEKEKPGVEGYREGQAPRLETGTKCVTARV